MPEKQKAEKPRPNLLGCPECGEASLVLFIVGSDGEELILQIGCHYCDFRDKEQVLVVKIERLGSLVFGRK